MTDATSTTARRRRMAREPQLAAVVTMIGTPFETVDKPKTRTSLVLEMLQRPDGASLNELVIATGWLPHTTRAALTCLRRKGHAIDKSKVDGVTRYALAPVAARENAL